VNGVAKRFSLEQTIQFKECRALDDLMPQRIYATRHFVVYQEEEQLLRYTHTSRISTAIGIKHPSLFSFHSHNCFASTASFCACPLCRPRPVQGSQLCLRL
jgi:hypothetical protein